MYFRIVFGITVGILVSGYCSNSHAQTWGANSYSQVANEAADVETTSAGLSYLAGYFTGQTGFGNLYSFAGTNGNADAYVIKYDNTGNVIWMQQFGGTLDDKAVDLAIGPDQNIVVTGSFFGSVTFGATTLNSSANSKDIFIVKMTPAGNVLWARKEGGNGIENGYKLTVDHQNNIILTGEYEGTATIGSNTFTSTTDPNTGNPSFDIFVSKYDPNGTPLWSLSGHADFDDRGLAAAVDNSDNIFLTGQFSDTLTFASNTYNNNGFNVGYLCKLNSAGQMQFFNMFKAGLTVPYEVEVNQNNEPIVIGDFLGNMNYVHQGGTVNITNPYEKQIFTIKTSNTGQYTWNNTLGSDNDISARSLAIDPSNSIFVTGYFKCDLSQLQDTVENLYSSIGFKDPYVMKISNSGGRTYLKHFGGQEDDEGKGISAYQTDKPYVCGSYNTDLNFHPGAGALIGGTVYSFNSFFGAEPYHILLAGDQSRNSFLETHVNNNYGNYNYYTDPAVDSLVGHLTAQTIPDYVYFVNDTVHFCGDANLFYDHLTYNHMGPGYDHLWYNGSQNASVTVYNTGNYWVTTERWDGCAVDVDTIYAIHEPTPTLPLLTDDHGINVLQPGPNYNDYHFCAPDSVEITFSGLQPGVTVTMTGPTETFNGLGPHVISEGPQYNIHVENQYCINDGEFVFILDYAIPPDTISPLIVMMTDVPTGDSIEVCQYTPVQFHGIDLFTNIDSSFVPQIEIPIDTVLWWIDGTSYPNNDTANVVYVPTTSGWHTVQMTVVAGYNNLCGIDTVHYTVSRQFYIEVNPLPDWSAGIIGASMLCPGDAEYLIASNPHPDLSWTGPAPIWTNGYDSLLVNSPGWYTYSGTLTDTTTGCSLQLVFNHYVGIKIPPDISSDVPDGVVCPGDSILLSVANFYDGYIWIDPNGDTLSYSSTCYVDEIGLYYCHITDSTGCVLVPDPFEVFEYSTPSLTAEPTNVLCQNESIVIHITHSGNSTFQWQGSSSTADSLVVTQPGTYVVQITACGITVEDSIVIYDGAFNVSAILGDHDICFGEEGVFFVNTNAAEATIEWYAGSEFIGSDNPITFSYAELAANPNISVTVSNDCYTQTVTDVVNLLPQTQLSISDDSLQLCFNDTQVVSILNPTVDSASWSAPFQSIDDTEITVLGNVSYPPISVVGFDQNNCATDTATIVVLSSDHTFSSSVDFTSFCPGSEGSVSIITNSDSAIWTTPLGTFQTSTLSFTLTEETSGIHVIQTWDSFGCTYYDSIPVLVAEMPNMNILPDTVFCLNDIYTFYFPSDTNTYVWLTYGNSTTIPIVSNQDLILQVTTPQGCIDYDTLFVETINCDNPLPNVITPNGDGTNDYLFIDDALSQLNNYILIYNRWDNLIYEAGPYKNDFNGTGLSEGVYFYLYYPNGKEHPDRVKQGFFHLIK